MFVQKHQRGPQNWTDNFATEKRPIGRPRHRWDVEIKMDLKSSFQCMKLELFITG